MRKVARCTTLMVVVLLTGLLGCDRKTEQAETPKVSTEKILKNVKVVVPPEVQGKWKAVKIAVQDKKSNDEEIYTVDIGSSFTVKNSDVSLRTKVFLPAFIMDGTTMTSASNEPKNPAVQISVSEGGEEIYQGWLFSLYPGAHAFQHPRFSFTLVDFIPSEKNVDN